MIALTFDDGPDPAHTPRILDLLAERDVRATFFEGPRRRGAPRPAHRDLALDTRDWDDDGGALSLAEVDAQLDADSVVLMHDPRPRTAALLAGRLERVEARGRESGLTAA